jgi:uncharacterized protein (DUF1697 family)
MSDLRDLLGSLGFAGAKSLLQSGNLVFKSKGPTGEALERLLESETEKRTKVRVDYLVRTAKDWQAIINGNPFGEAAKRDPGHLVVMCLKTAPQAKDVKDLQAAIKGPEVCSALGKQLYVVYPDGIGPSKFSHTIIEKMLGTRGTGRNWNTVLKLGALTQE